MGLGYSHQGDRSSVENVTNEEEISTHVHKGFVVDLSGIPRCCYGLILELISSRLNATQSRMRS